MSNFRKMTPQLLLSEKLSNFYNMNILHVILKERGLEIPLI